jgi:hypothetical protein
MEKGVLAFWQLHKRDPVLVYHLSSPSIATGVYQPTPQDRTGSPYLRFAPENPGIFGLSTHEVYLHAMLPSRAVSSYLTFSPFPFQ